MLTRPPFARLAAGLLLVGACAGAPVTIAVLENAPASALAPADVHGVCSNPEATAEPSSVAPGESVSLTGCGFEPNASVQVDVDGPQPSSFTVSADSSGQVSTSVSFDEPGEYRLILSDGAAQAYASVTVSGGQEPTEEPSTEPEPEPSTSEPEPEPTTEEPTTEEPTTGEPTTGEPTGSTGEPTEPTSSTEPTGTGEPSDPPSDTDEPSEPVEEPTSTDGAGEDPSTEPTDGTEEPSDGTDPEQTPSAPAGETGAEEPSDDGTTSGEDSPGTDEQPSEDAPTELPDPSANGTGADDEPTTSPAEHTDVPSQPTDAPSGSGTGESGGASDDGAVQAGEALARALGLMAPEQPAAPSDAGGAQDELAATGVEMRLGLVGVVLALLGGSLAVWSARRALRD